MMTYRAIAPPTLNMLTRSQQTLQAIAPDLQKPRPSKSHTKNHGNVIPPHDNERWVSALGNRAIAFQSFPDIQFMVDQQLG
jgi:hypothetical protein